MMKERNLDILGLSETKRRQNGNEELREGFHIYWSGGEDAKNGVAIVVNKELNEAITEVVNISERLMKIKFKFNNEIVSVLQCYAPQSGCSDEDKIEFETLLENNLRENNNIIIGYYW